VLSTRIHEWVARQKTQASLLLPGAKPGSNQN
jgi:hypothetical protein